ncbi:hypothetical protein vseg_004991 [Gypsophila vaccaria]
MFKLKSSILFLLLTLLVNLKLMQCSVTYDRKSLIINGHRKIIISGSIHYPRSTPEMWEDLIMKAKEGGLDCIDTYVFWNVHEPSPGNYNFEGRNDVVRFLKIVEKAGLYAHLRLGPYVCAEWNFGGFPVWLKYVPGISFRTDNEPFKKAMQGFTEKIVSLLKSHNLYQSQGGPVILSQIENEYGNLRKRFGQEGYNYMSWAAKMAVNTRTGVPWTMCKDIDTPDPVINTCNGFYCHQFTPNRPYKPKLWTEAWSGWFTEFGKSTSQRPVQDLAFAVARFIQTGGSLVNYYMYHGGTNFGRTAGGPFITTSYDYDAPIDEYGLIRQQKYGHLRELHKAIKLCESALVSADPIVTELGPRQQAHVFYPVKGNCAAFLSNYDPQSAVKILFNNKHYNLPPWSISILPDCKNVAFNTAKVGEQTSRMEMMRSNANIYPWESYNEDVSALQGGSTMSAFGLLEQINITRDSTDYLWYKTSVHVNPSESFFHGGKLPTLIVESTGHAVHAFVNGQPIGSAFGARKARRFTFIRKVKLLPGTNRIALLSVAVGLPNVGSHYENWNTGILGLVVLEGLDKGRLDLSRKKWTYQVGLKGEFMNLASPNSVSMVDWMDSKIAVQRKQPLVWHKAYFDAPEGNEPLGVDMNSMGKGQVWINGVSIGRYWTTVAQGDCNGCSYAGRFQPPKCQVGCGKPSQRWYHVPRSWLKPRRNLIVVFEEMGGDPTKISVGKRSVSSVCAQVSEYHPSIKSWQLTAKSAGRTQVSRTTSKLHLQCASSQYISSITFASFGTPLGTCGKYKKGKCHAPTSYSILRKRCVGKQKCAVAITNRNFGNDPCPDVLKRLSVEAVCTFATSTMANQTSLHN